MNLKKYLQSVPNPDIDSDRSETIEEEVGDSVTDAYNNGFDDGEDTGRYNLAQELLAKLDTPEQRHHDHYVRRFVEEKLTDEEFGQFRLAMKRELDGDVVPAYSQRPHPEDSGAGAGG